MCNLPFLCGLTSSIKRHSVVTLLAPTKLFVLWLILLKHIFLSFCEIVNGIKIGISMHFIVGNSDNSNDSRSNDSDSNYIIVM